MARPAKPLLAASAASPAPPSDTSRRDDDSDASTSTTTTKKRRKRRKALTTDEDIAILRAVLAVRPHHAAHGQGRRRWQETADHVIQAVGGEMSTTLCKGRFDNLLRRFVHEQEHGGDWPVDATRRELLLAALEDQKTLERGSNGNKRRIVELAVASDRAIKDKSGLKENDKEGDGPGHGDEPKSGEPSTTTVTTTSKSTSTTTTTTASGKATTVTTPTPSTTTTPPATTPVAAPPAVTPPPPTASGSSSSISRTTGASVLPPPAPAASTPHIRPRQMGKASVPTPSNPAQSTTPATASTPPSTKGSTASSPSPALSTTPAKPTTTTTTPTATRTPPTSGMVGTPPVATPLPRAMLGAPPATTSPASVTVSSVHASRTTATSPATTTASPSKGSGPTRSSPGFSIATLRTIGRPVMTPSQRVPASTMTMMQATSNVRRQLATKADPRTLSAAVAYAATEKAKTAVTATTTTTKTTAPSPTTARNPQSAAAQPLDPRPVPSSAASPSQAVPTGAANPPAKGPASLAVASATAVQQRGPQAAATTASPPGAHPVSLSTAPPTQAASAIIPHTTIAAITRVTPPKSTMATSGATLADAVAPRANPSSLQRVVRSPPLNVPVAGAVNKSKQVSQAVPAGAGQPPVSRAVPAGAAQPLVSRAVPASTAHPPVSRTVPPTAPQPPVAGLAFAGSAAARNNISTVKPGTTNTISAASTPTTRTATPTRPPAALLSASSKAPSTVSPRTASPWLSHPAQPSPPVDASSRTVGPSSTPSAPQAQAASSSSSERGSAPDSGLLTMLNRLADMERDWLQGRNRGPDTGLSFGGSTASAGSVQVRRNEYHDLVREVEASRRERAELKEQVASLSSALEASRQERVRVSDQVALLTAMIEEGQKERAELRQDVASLASLLNDVPSHSGMLRELVDAQQRQAEELRRYQQEDEARRRVAQIEDRARYEELEQRLDLLEETSATSEPQREPSLDGQAVVGEPTPSPRDHRGRPTKKSRAFNPFAELQATLEKQQALITLYEQAQDVHDGHSRTELELAELRTAIDVERADRLRDYEALLDNIERIVTTGESAGETTGSST